MGTHEPDARHSMRVVAEVVAWCAAILGAYLALVLLLITGNERCGGTWLFSTIEPDPDCYLPWQVLAWVPGAAVGAALLVRLATLARRHRAVVRLALIGRRPDSSDPT